ncbi:MAG: hypothetical protein AAGA44_14915, partial [Pseudomonadota bacterium]
DVQASVTGECGLIFSDPVCMNGKTSLFGRGSWWARQDSNLGPRDSLNPTVSGGVDYLITLDRIVRGGTL